MNGGIRTSSCMSRSRPVPLGREDDPFDEELALLHPTPGDLRAALSRYADAVIEDERRSHPDTVRRREDTAYTLCVMTGVTDVRQAVKTADALLRTGTHARPATLNGGKRPAPPRPRRTGTASV